MGDSNAWDMLAESSCERKHSWSPSKGSRVDSEVILNIDDAELQALGLGKEQLAEEAEKERVEQKRRSKSPALESIRKVSMHVLQKIGALHRKKDVSNPLCKFDDIEQLPLDQFCRRPKEFFQEPIPFFFRDLGKVVQPLPETTSSKCAYLFRGASFEDDLEAPTELRKLDLW